ncbi:unnamed protein product [Protopolystoma xenopodis]|uniref:Uncharacterized protein n=1 Tax=Protopolystoma xenopodis TaxID=117903 RepID=A0A448WVF6_9PLAT|nr:unnamed protein product [Protopolystoma xenopodis]
MWSTKQRVSGISAYTPTLRMQDHTKQLVRARRKSIMTTKKSVNARRVNEMGGKCEFSKFTTCFIEVFFPR